MAADEIDEIDPLSTWRDLENSGSALLIDVRTRAEWNFVGAPMTPANRPPLAMIEWKDFPDGAINAGFAEAAIAAVRESGATTAYFLCRSGVRSLHAARATDAAARAEGRELRCVNVIGGFEGDPDPDGHRGVINGWKAQGLPWRQN